MYYVVQSLEFVTVAWDAFFDQHAVRGRTGNSALEVTVHSYRNIPGQLGPIHVLAINSLAYTNITEQVRTDTIYPQLRP